MEKEDDVEFVLIPSESFLEICGTVPLQLYVVFLWLVDGYYMDVWKILSMCVKMRFVEL